MRDGRPNVDIWGNILTCVEIGYGIYCIIGDKNKGIEMARKTAEELLPESVQTQLIEDNSDVCSTDSLSNDIILNTLQEKGLLYNAKESSISDALKQLEEPDYVTGFKPAISDIELEGLEL